MKTIGIITTFRQPNWGSVLQAYALQQAVLDMDYDVKVIDYKYPNEYHYAHGRKRLLKDNLKTRFGRLRREWFMRLGLMKKDKMFMLNQFIERNVNVTRKYISHTDIHNDPPHFDIYLAGSDQIWNPNTMLGDMTYMFDFAGNESKKIAYASSFSCLNIPEKYKTEYIRHLSSFMAISVREDNGAKTARYLLDKDVPVVLDPTMLLNKEQWHEIAQQSAPLQLPEKYILCYMLAYTYSPEESMAKLLEAAQAKYPYPVISLTKLPASYHGKIYSVDCPIGIAEFLQLIERSSIVISSSFHGSAFALNFGKPLLGLTEDNDDDRLLTIFRKVGLEGNLLYSSHLNFDILDPFYNVDYVQSCIEKLRQISKEYLQNSLNN